MADFDVIVIGAGPGGLAAAEKVAPEKKVLVVENNLWGGTCPNFGCDPKKMLYSAVQAKDYAGRMTHAGLVGIPDVNWPKLMAFKRGYTETVPSGTKAGLDASGIQTVHGTPTFTAAKTITVNGKVYSADKVVIATGQTPRIPQIPGADLLGTSTDFLDLDQLPHTIAFIGAGFVSLELANIAAAAGAKVHIINRTKRMLRSFPEAAVAVLEGEMAARGIQIHSDVTITKVEKTGEQVTLSDNKGFSLKVAKAFAAMGRVPVIPAGLKDLGLATTAKGIVVDDHLQTNLPGVYALGDVLAKTQPKLTPVASFEGRYIASQLLGQTDPIRYPAQPEVVYGTLQLAQVGVHLEDAEKQPERYTVTHENVTNWYTYHRIEEKMAQVWTIVDKQNGQLVGAVVAASIADELINYLTLLMAGHISASAAKELIYAYPTPASDFQYLM